MAKGGHNGNGHGHATETPDVSYIRNLDVTHEASDVSIGSILKFVLGLTIFGVIVSVLMWGTFRFLNSRETQKEPQPGPMAMGREERLPPEPRLQAAPGFGVKLEDGKWVHLENKEPQAEYQELRKQWDQKLNCEKPATDSHHEAEATVHEPAESSPAQMAPCMPIDEAMQKLVEKGLPARTGSAIGEDIALPTAASSGRVSGVRRQ